MNSKKSMGEILYDLLPQLYKVEDAKQKPIPYPLKRYLQVTGIGLDFMRSKIEGHSNIFDLDKAPPELLPHLAKTLGFEFPYDMTEKEQRSLLKVLPILYKLKGTQTVFDYLARQIFGLDAKAYSEWVSRGGLKKENLIEINVEASGELSNLQTRIDRYYKYSELFRPVNHKLFWQITLYYTDVFNKQKILDEYDIEQLFIDDDHIVPLGNEHLLNRLLLNQDGFPLLKGDVYDIKSKYTEELIETLKYIEDDVSVKIREDDVYNNSGKDDSYFIETATINDTEIYLATKEDNYRYDVLTDLTNCLNMGMLNSTILLSKKPAITVYQ